MFADAAASDAAPASDSGLDLVALDRALSPLRRLLAYAVDRSPPPYAVENARRLLSAVPGAGLPDPLAALIAESRSLLDDDEDEDVRLIGVYQRLSRLDSVLGLPMPLRIERPAKRQSRPKKSRKRKKGSRSRKKKQAETSSASRSPEPTPTSWWSGNPLRPLLELDDVDPGLVEALDALGIRTVGDLLGRRPPGHDVLRPVHGAGREVPSGPAAVGGRVVQRRTTLGPGGSKTLVTLQGAGPMEAVWTSAVPWWMAEALTPGRRVVLVGTMTDGQLVDGELARDEGKRGVCLHRYQLEGCDDRDVRALVWRLLAEAADVHEPLPNAMRAEHDLVGLREAWQSAHLLGSEEGRRRLAFQEALMLQLGLLHPRFHGNRERGITQTVVHGQVATLFRLEGVELNDEQQVALEEIKRDLRRPQPMRRVLTGPAGAGKGRVALAAAIVVAENKHQVLWLCPDQVTAQARYDFLSALLSSLDLRVELLTGADGSLRDQLQKGSVAVLVATPETFEASSASFRRLGLLISEEPESPGLGGELLESLKSPLPDVLIHTGTSVADEVLLGAYATYGVSQVTTAGGAPLTVSRWEDGQRLEAFRHAAEVVARHRQVLVCFPTSKSTGADLLDAREATQMVSALRSEAFPEGTRIALYHGGLERRERHRVYLDFVHHRHDVLVATYPPELGPPIPMLGAIVVVRAEHLSAVRLRRLRAHLESSLDGGELQFVVGEVPDERSEHRLAWIGDPKRSDDWVADRLCEQAGPQLQWLDHAPRSILLGARRAASEILESDPALRRGTGPDLAKWIRMMWPGFYGEPAPLPDSVGSAKRRRRRRRRR